MRIFSLGDVAAAFAAALVFYAVRAYFVRNRVPLPAEPFAFAAAASVFCGVKGSLAFYRAVRAGDGDKAAEKGLFVRREAR